MPRNTGSVAVDIEATAARLDAIILARDRLALNAAIAADFEQVLGDGSRVNRAGFIDALTNGPVAEFSVGERRARSIGQAAVVTFTLKYPNGPKVFVVDIYRRASQRWILEFEQITVPRAAR